MAKTKSSSLSEPAQRLSRAHFLVIAAYVLTSVIFDSWNLLARDAVDRRWLGAGLLLAINTGAWYLAHNQFKSESAYRGLIWTLVIADILFAAANVYWERGMAATSAILFAVPLISVAVLKSRTALVATATLCAGAYAAAAVKYFFDFYGEGYRVQLYGQIFFFALLFYALAWLLLVVAETPGNKRA